MQEQRFKEAEYRQNQIGTQFTSCPPDQVTRVFITGQIISAQQFPEVQMFISYKITMPLGWKTQIPQQLVALDLSPQQLKQLNCLESITQSVMPIVERNKDGGVVNKFYFSFPIDLQLLHKEKIKQWPVIHFQIYSKDYWERIFMHGCGFVNVPSSPGTYVLQTQTWKPTIDLRTRISQFFLGGLIRAKNIQEISKWQKLDGMDQKSPVNRYLFNTLSSGKIKVRLNVATQSKKVKTDERVNFKAQKLSQQTQQKKKEMNTSIPSFVNTGNVLGGRFTNTKL